MGAAASYGRMAHHIGRMTAECLGSPWVWASSNALLPFVDWGEERLSLFAELFLGLGVAAAICLCIAPLEARQKEAGWHSIRVSESAPNARAFSHRQTHERVQWTGLGGGGGRKCFKLWDIGTWARGTCGEGPPRSVRPHDAPHASRTPHQYAPSPPQKYGPCPGHEVWLGPTTKWPADQATGQPPALCECQAGVPDKGPSRGTAPAANGTASSSHSSERSERSHAALPVRTRQSGSLHKGTYLVLTVSQNPPLILRCAPRCPSPALSCTAAGHVLQCPNTPRHTPHTGPDSALLLAVPFPPQPHCPSPCTHPHCPSPYPHCPSPCTHPHCPSPYPPLLPSSRFVLLTGPQRSSKNCRISVSVTIGSRLPAKGTAKACTALHLLCSTPLANGR